MGKVDVNRHDKGKGKGKGKGKMTMKQQHANHNFRQFRAWCVPPSPATCAVWGHAAFSAASESTGLELLVHTRFVSLQRTLSVRIRTDVSFGAIAFSGHSRH